MCKADHFSLTAQALTDAFHVLRCLKNLIMAKKKNNGVKIFLKSLFQFSRPCRFTRHLIDNNSEKAFSCIRWHTLQLEIWHYRTTAWQLPDQCLNNYLKPLVKLTKHDLAWSSLRQSKVDIRSYSKKKWRQQSYKVSWVDSSICIIFSSYLILYNGNPIKS